MTPKTTRIFGQKTRANCALFCPKRCTSLLAMLMMLVSLTSMLAIQVNAEAGSKISRRKLDLAKSGNQIGDWLVHQVAPVVATKLIDNVLSTPTGSKKAAKSVKEADSQPATIDTHALADKIVDKLADSIKRRKQQQAASTPADTTTAERSMKSTTKHDESASPKQSNRRGKSLVSDSVQQVMQNLFSKDQRTFFGRAMEKHSKLQAPHRSSSSSPNSWHMIKEPSYEPHLFVSTDSSQLDENPVVLRAEHGYNATSTASPPVIHHAYQPNRQHQQVSSNHQKQRLQQKYVHTNRHQQQQLAPKPWQGHNNNQRVRQPGQQSPYSLSVVSDMNIVQAPSSPAPPPITTTPATTTTSTSTLPPTTTTTTTTTSMPPPQFVPQHHHHNQHHPHHQVTHVGSNKFKINNRHQHPVSSVAISPSSWYSSNNHHDRYHNNNHHRYPLPSSTTSTTTTTTTTTTTPEPPPPQTDPNEMMASDLDQQTSAPLVSSILSSVAQSAFDSLGGSSSSSSGQMDSDYGSSYQQIAQNSSSSQYGSASSSASSSPSTSGTKGASPSTTTARHSVISAEAIPTALGAPLYHLTRANFTTTSIMGPPPRRSGPASPAAKVMAQYLQKGVNSLSSTIFGRQSKTWARRLGLSSVLLSGLLYGAAVLANPGAPLPTNGLQVLQAISKGTKKRRGGGFAGTTGLAGGDGETLLTSGTFDAATSSGPGGDIDRITNAALLDNNVNILYQQQPHLISIIEQLIQQEAQQQHQQLLLQQRQQPQSSLFSQRSLTTSPIEILSVQGGNNNDELPESSEYQSSSSSLLSSSSPSAGQPTAAQRRAGPSQAIYTLQALPTGSPYAAVGANANDILGKATYQGNRN